MPDEHLFVKLSWSYADDVAIASGTDAAEVMFVRGITYCARAKSPGFIPRTALLSLTRRTSLASALKVARELCREVGGKPGPWREVDGGFQIRNYENWQDALLAIEERRANDRARAARKRERDRAERALSLESQDIPVGTSRDSHVTVTAQEVEEEVEEETAAAAAVPERGGSGGAKATTSDDLPMPVAILASKMRAFTPLQMLRFDGLTPTQLEQLLDLINIHGDDRLLALAKTNLRNPPPVSVKAFLKSWATAPVPGQVLAAVDDPKCQHCGHTQRSCELLAARNDDPHPFVPRSA